MEKAEVFRFVDEKKAATILDISVQTLRSWRLMRKGPAYFKMGRSVRYKVADLNTYADERRIDPERMV